MCSSQSVGMFGPGSILSEKFIRFCGIFILSFYFSKAQNVTFRLSDENTNRFIFYGETDIDIVCEVSGISGIDGVSFEVRRNSDIIYNGQNVPSEFSNRYIVSNGNLSRTITLTEATSNTVGTYLCVVSFGSESISGTLHLNLTESVQPQCWANKTNELTEGESIRLQCYYGDASNQLESYWENINQDLQRETLNSSEVFEGVKKIRTADVESISLHNDGSTYRCGVTHKQFNIFPIFTCEIGPISVTRIIEMISSSTEKPTNVQTDNNVVSSEATSHPPTISLRAETTVSSEPYTTAKQQVTMFSSVRPSEPIVVTTNPLDSTIPESSKRTVSTSPVDYLTRNTFTVLKTSTVSLPGSNGMTTIPPNPTTLSSSSQAVSSTQSNHVTYERLTLPMTSSHTGVLTTTSSTPNDAQSTTIGAPPHITTKHSSQDSTAISTETSGYVSGSTNVSIHVMTSGDDLDDLVTTLLTSESEGMSSTYLPPEVESPQSRLLQLLLFYIIPLFVVIVLIILILPLICICSRRRHDPASNDFSLGYAGSSRNSHYYDSSITPSNHNETAVQANGNAVGLNSAGNHGDDEPSIEKVYNDPANTWIESTHL